MEAKAQIFFVAHLKCMFVHCGKLMLLDVVPLEFIDDEAINQTCGDHKSLH